VTAHAFVITDLQVGRVLGQAVLCAEARYVSIAWRGASRLDRRFVTPMAWRSVEREVRDLIPPGPLARQSAIVRLFGLTSGQVAQYLSQAPIEAAPGAVAATLDSLLRRMAA
jgi:hypothetical protein